MTLLGSVWPTPTVSGTTLTVIGESDIVATPPVALMSVEPPSSATEKEVVKVPASL